MFGFFKTKKVDTNRKWEILFGPECAGKVEHGSIVGTWIREGVESRQNISFNFNGHEMPPPLSDETIGELFRQARHAGIVPLRLYSWEGIMKPNRNRYK